MFFNFSDKRTSEEKVWCEADASSSEGSVCSLRLKQGIYKWVSLCLQTCFIFQCIIAILCVCVPAFAATPDLAACSWAFRQGLVDIIAKG